MIGCELQFNIVLGKCEWSRHHPCIVTSKERKSIISFNFQKKKRNIICFNFKWGICNQHIKTDRSFFPCNMPTRVQSEREQGNNLTGIVYQTQSKKKVVKVGNNHLSRKIWHQPVIFNHLETQRQKISPKISKTDRVKSSYIRILSGRPEELKSAANFLTDAIELRSNSMTSILAEGISLSIVSLTFLPLSTLLTAITTWTLRNARTRVVSRPRPLVAPKHGLYKYSISW